MPFGGLLTAGALGAGGSILGGLFGSMGSGQYIKALKQAQQFLQQQEQQGLQNYQPFLQGGTSAENMLSGLLGTSGQGLLIPWTQKFTAPTAEQAAQTPGYQFQLQQGLNAMQNSAAGQGGLLSGRTLADLNNYAQGTASTNYQNTFNNALTQYQSAYNTFLNNQANTYNMLSGQAGMGMQAANGMGSLISNIGGDIGSLYGQMGAARAQGTMAMGQGLSGAMGTLGSMGMLYGLSGGANGPFGGGGGYGASPMSDFSYTPDTAINAGGPTYMPGGGPNVPAPTLGYAEGTDFAPGGMAVVGEKGPELIHLPRGSRVIPYKHLHMIPLSAMANPMGHATYAS